MSKVRERFSQLLRVLLQVVLHVLKWDPFIDLMSPTSTFFSGGCGRTRFERGQYGGTGRDPAPSTAPISVTSRLSTDGKPWSNPGSNTNEAAAEAPPAIPSYIAQAATLFPLSKRQSVHHLPPMPILSDPAAVSAEPNTKPAPAGDAVDNASSSAMASTSASSTSCCTLVDTFLIPSEVERRAKECNLQLICL